MAPLRPVYKVWPDEIKKWSEFNELTYTILHGPEKAIHLQDKVDIYIINPEGLLWLLQPTVAKPDFDALCIDESTRFKNSQSKRFKLLKPWISQFKRRWILTGTPNPNGLEDLFSQIYILDQGRALGKYVTHFRNNYFIRTGFNLYDIRPRPGAFEDVVEKISPLILQLSAEDYLEMPELVHRDIVVTLPTEAMARYQEVEDYFITALEEEKIVAANAAAAGTKCRQIANGAVYSSENDGEWLEVHSEKLDALESLIEEFNGAPVIIMYEYQHDKERILKRIGDVPVLGDLTPKKFGETIDLFNRGEIPIVIGHPGSMAHGLNLQASCHRMVWFGITWNLEYYDQAIARIYRQGQSSDRVFVYHIVAKDTLDEAVLRRLNEKDIDQQHLLHGISQWRRDNLNVP